MVAPSLEQMMEDQTVVGALIDGRWYPYADRGLWSLRQALRFSTLSKRAQVLETLEREPTDEEDAEYRVVVENMAKLAIPMLADETVAQLGTAQLASIALDFLLRVQSPSMQVTTMLTDRKARLRLSTGQSHSLASVASMASGGKN